MEENGIAIRRELFTDPHLSDETIIASQYEESNALVRSYQNYDDLEQSLFTASLACVYAANSVRRFTEEEVNAGLMVSADIACVATLMGYDFNTTQGKKAAYNGIKKAAETIRGESITTESNGSFSTWGPIDNVIYNPDNDGKVYFKFNTTLSKMIVNNKEDFTVYSIMMRNRVKKEGKVNGVRLYEILKSYLYLAQKNPKGITHVRYDYIDLRCELGLINTKNETVRELIKSSKYEGYATKDEIAYKRLLALEDIDTLAKEALYNYKNSSEYKNKKNLPKEEKEQLEKKYKNLNAAIACQYNDYDDFRKRILKTTQELFKGIYEEKGNQMDMMFEYKPYKYRDRVIAIDFNIYTIDGYVSKELSDGVQLSMKDLYTMWQNEKQEPAKEVVNPEKVNVENAMPKGQSPDRKNLRRRNSKSEDFDTTFTKMTEYIASLSADEKYVISPSDMIKLCKGNDSEQIIKAYKAMIAYGKRKEIESPIAVITAAIKGKWEAGKSGDKYNDSNKNTFNEMIHTDYDIEEIEKKFVVT